MYCPTARAFVQSLPRRQRPVHAGFHHSRATQSVHGTQSAVIGSSLDVWTEDFITPQERKAQLRAPIGPLIPEFLVEVEGYEPDEYVEIGFVWKAIGARGEVLVRVCTSLQDYRVGLPGPRCEHNIP
jgi:hypothetical protein